MNLTLGTIPDDPRCLKKDYTASVTVSNAKPYGELSILTPYLILDWDSSYESCNYAYISDFDRYYYIKKISPTTGSKCILQLQEDVLMTYKDQILNCSGVINFNEERTRANFFLQHPEVIAQMNTRTQAHPFDTSAWTPNTGNTALFCISVIK